MTWIETPRRSVHRCEPPMSRRKVSIPPWPGETGWTTGLTEPMPDGDRGDLWRCDCGRLWRLAEACDMCDAYGQHPHGGQHAVGNRWRPARLWQVIRHWRRGR